MELPDDELQTTVIDLLKVEIGEILRIAPDKIDATLSVQSMGLDSLMGVELVVAVESRFGARLPVMALSDSPTVAKLAGWIITQLRGGDAATLSSNSTDPVMAQIERVVTQHAAEVQDSDLEHLAANIRTGAGAANRRMIN
jgi:phthiocerol/phenolphthiocerol synthesis type-I polyketide synthase C